MSGYFLTIAVEGEREDVVVITVESVHMVVIGTVRVHVSVCVAN